MTIKSTALVTFVCVGFGIVVAGLLLSVTVKAECQNNCPNGPCADPPCCNGDVNGDGGIDLADAVYILQNLFAQGADIVPIDCGQCAVDCTMPATGQNVCYDSAGNVTDPDNEQCPGQDGSYQSGCPMEGRFVDHGDGTVTDNCTGLTWQQATADIPGDDDNQVTWAAALRYCEDLVLGGQSDWRLPNVRELQSIVDYGRYGPAVDPVFSAHAHWYWTSSSGVGSPHLGTDEAWHIFFGIGSVYGAPKSDLHYVRAVRGCAQASLNP